MSIPVGITLGLLVVGGFFYMGIWMWRRPEYFVSQYANLFESVFGAKPSGKERDRWLRVLRKRYRMQGLLCICVSLIVFLFALWSLAKYLLG
ncbi:MAG TPA: hypothetical protein PKC89_02385 [Pyrinomonadaceae bacterium]|nr:hypothetical protein [Pyrinomonadaceae bacterium]